MTHVVIGTAGHIDHGKSSLVLALTGTDPDRLKEEKARGITIDLGFAHYEADGVNFAFVDVPGHERFVKNMLAGASGIDYVLLVVAADESVMPQTREHFEICRLLSVPEGVIALTKADLVDEDTIELVRLETRELVAGSFLDAAPIVPVSAKTGRGLDDLRRALAGLAARAGSRPSAGVGRLPIDRVFSIKGFGTVVTGTLVSGRMATDEELVLLPSGRPVKVRGLQVHGSRQGTAAAGQRTAANLGGVELADVTRGETLVTPGAFEPTRRFDAALELLPGARPLRHGARVRFHYGTSELLGRVAVSQVAGEAVSLDAPPPSEIPAGGRAHVRLRLEAPAVVTRGDRYILRAYSPPVTIGGGQVLDPHPPRGGTRTKAARLRFRRLAARGPDGLLDQVEAAAAMIDERGAAGLPVAALVSRAGESPESAADLVERLVRAGRAVRVQDLLIPPALLDQLKDRLLALVGQHHGANPLAEGMPREEARERLFGRAAPVVFEHVVATLVASNALVARDRLALATHRVSLSADETRARAAIERAYESGGLKPPDAGSLAGLAGVSGEVADRVVKLLIRQRLLVKVDTLIFHASALERLKEDIRGLKGGAGGGRVDVATFKERYDVTRKFAIPLLEYLDRERVTKRAGDARVVL
jgi:selenocysteine-specific elongation factor